MKRWLLAAACGVVALGLLLYPLVGELLSEKYHSDVETAYTAAIEDTDDAELTAQRQAAQQYTAGYPPKRRISSTATRRRKITTPIRLWRTSRGR